MTLPEVGQGPTQLHSGSYGGWAPGRDARGGGCGFRRRGRCRYLWKCSCLNRCTASRGGYEMASRFGRRDGFGGDAHEALLKLIAASWGAEVVSHRRASDRLV